MRILSAAGLSFGIATLAASAQASTPSWLVVEPPANGSSAQSVEQVMPEFYPERAVRMDVSGETAVQCDAAVSGEFNNCAIAAERPSGYGFGVATLRLMQHLRVKPAADGSLPVRGSVLIPFHWKITPPQRSPVARQASQ